MQPDAAFWALSSIAQSSAALAGLTALLLVFVLTLAARGLGMPLEVGITELLRRVPLSWTLGAGTFLYLMSVLVALTFIGTVDPGIDPVAPEVALAVVFSLALLAGGSIALTTFILNPRKWFETREHREKRRETKRRLKKEGRWPP